MPLRPGDFKHVTAERVFTPVGANAGRRTPSRRPREVKSLNIRKVATTTPGRARAVAAAAYSLTFTLQWPSHRCSGR